MKRIALVVMVTALIILIASTLGGFFDGHRPVSKASPHHWKAPSGQVASAAKPKPPHWF